MSIIPKDLLPIIGQYTRPDVYMLKFKYETEIQEYDDDYDLRTSYETISVRLFFGAVQLNFIRNYLSKECYLTNQILRRLWHTVDHTEFDILYPGSAASNRYGEQFKWHAYDPLDDEKLSYLISLMFKYKILCKINIIYF